MKQATKIFNLSRFQVHEDDADIPQVSVCIPKTAFRIHVDPKRRIDNVYIARIDGQWHLVESSVRATLLQRGIVVTIASLYEGYKANGQSFILPVTYNKNPEIWQNSAIKMVKQARKSWVRRVADDVNKQHVTYIEGGIGVTPEWADDFNDLIEQAFYDRLIDDQHSLLKNKLRCSEIDED